VVNVSYRTTLGSSLRSLSSLVASLLVQSHLHFLLLPLHDVLEYLATLKQGVSVTAHEALLIVRDHTRGSAHEARLRKGSQSSPDEVKLIGSEVVAKVNDLDGSAEKVNETLPYPATTKIVVATVGFRVSLLYECRPEVVIGRFRIHCASRNCVGVGGGKWGEDGGGRNED